MSKKLVVAVSINERAETIEQAEKLQRHIEAEAHTVRRAIETAKENNRELYPDAHKAAKKLNAEMKNNFDVRTLAGFFFLIEKRVVFRWSDSERIEIEVHNHGFDRIFSVDAEGRVVYGSKNSTDDEVIRVRKATFDSLGEIVWEKPETVEQKKEERVHVKTKKN